jgi:transposase
MASDRNPAARERLRRRRYDTAFKRALVEQTQLPGASVARIAREHGINANQLFTWRRQFFSAEQDTPVPSSPAQLPASLVPVTVVADQPVPGARAATATGEGQIEIRLAAGEIRIHGAVDAATLQVVLSSLRR